MSAITTTSDNMSALVEKVIIEGDLAKLTPAERVNYYSEVCRSVGLNPLTKPFGYLSLNSKLVLYALKACTDQLRYIHKVSVESLTNTTLDGVYIVTAKVKNAEGRTDVDDGAVSIGGLKGEALANAVMKAATKAKRRATLSICGLGLLDETEISSIPGAVTRDPDSASPPPPALSPPPAPRPPAPRAEVHDAVTGEVGPIPIPVPTEDGKERFTPWGKLLIAAIMAAPDYPDIDAIMFANQEALGRCGQAAPKAADSIKKAVAKRSNELLEGAKIVPIVATSTENLDWLAELEACTTEAAVCDIRDRAIANMFPGDLAAFKQACADKSAALF